MIFRSIQKHRLWTMDIRIENTTEEAIQHLLTLMVVRAAASLKTVKMPTRLQNMLKQPFGLRFRSPVEAKKKWSIASLLEKVKICFWSLIRVSFVFQIDKLKAIHNKQKKKFVFPCVWLYVPRPTDPTTLAQKRVLAQFPTNCFLNC